MKEGDFSELPAPVLSKAFAISMFVNWSGSNLKFIGFDWYYSLGKAFFHNCASLRGICEKVFECLACFVFWRQNFKGIPTNDFSLFLSRKKRNFLSLHWDTILQDTFMFNLLSLESL